MIDTSSVDWLFKSRLDIGGAQIERNKPFNHAQR